MKFIYLVKRNFLIFIRDRGAVFFSLLSMLIIIVLMAVFLGNMNVDELLDLLTRYGGIRNTQEDREHAQYLVLMWTIAGILVVNSVTVSLAVLGTMVTDAQEQRLMSFYTAPVKRIEIALGYIVTSVIVSAAMCFLTFILAEIWVWGKGWELPGMQEHIRITGLIILDSIAASAILYLAAMWVKSSSAWSAMGTVVGTLVGFVGAIYLPMGMLPEAVGKVLKCTPVLHGTALMRGLLTRQAVEVTFAGLDGQVAAGYREAMGITILWDESEISPLFSICFLAGCVIIAIAAAAVCMKRRKA